MKYLFIFILSFSILLGFQHQTATAHSLEKEEMTSLWIKQYRTLHAGSPYVIEPKLSAPQVLGKLDEVYLDDALRTTNFVRLLTGLPANVRLVDSLNSKAQHGAILLAMYGNLSHYPTRPIDLDEEFYNIGYKSTSTSNIAAGFATIETSIRKGYMEDGDLSNLDRVGHRRWVLDPYLQTTGFGFAENVKTSYGRFMSMQVINRDSKTSVIDYDYVAYPSAGNFPLEYFGENYPWSISLNPQKYQKPLLNDVSIKLTRASDSKVWYLDKSDNTLRNNTEYFNVDHGGYGGSSSIIFRAPIKEILSGDQFTAEIDGLKNIHGEEVSVSYSVNFFNMMKSLTIESEKDSQKSSDRIHYQVWLHLMSGEKLNITNEVEIEAAAWDVDSSTSHNGQFDISHIKDKYNEVDLNGCYYDICSEKEIIVDNEPPKLYGVRNKTIYLNQSFNSMSHVKAEDKVDGDLTKAIKIDGKINRKKTGKYTLSYSISDKVGNHVTKNRIITVKKVKKK